MTNTVVEDKLNKPYSTYYFQEWLGTNFLMTMSDGGGVYEASEEMKVASQATLEGSKWNKGRSYL